MFDTDPNIDIIGNIDNIYSVFQEIVRQLQAPIFFTDLLTIRSQVTAFDNA